MSENIRNIAMRIRELRDIAGISLETLAHEFGISRDAYQEYESGETDIPVNFLFQVSHRFGVELTDLLTGESRAFTSIPLSETARALPSTGENSTTTSTWHTISAIRRSNRSW